MNPRIAFIVLLVALASAVHAEDAANPLKDLPSKPGAHIDKIKALGDNEWLDLGSPAPDQKWGKARGRSWTPKMAFAPDLGGAFFCATGQHGYVKPDGHYMDDLWFYDIYAHRWICLYPGADTKSLKLHLDKNGFEVNEQGDPIPVSYLSHGYNNMSYNADLKKYMFCPIACPWWDSALPQRWGWLGIPKEKQTYGNTGAVIGSPKHPWFFDVATGKWERPFISGEGPVNSGQSQSVLEYIPSQKKAFFFHKDGPVWIYDFSSVSWVLSKNKPGVPSYSCAACLDTKREKIYFCKDDAFWIYDPATQTASNAQPAHEPKQVSGAWGENMTYDAANDVVILNRYWDPTKNSGLKLGICVYDPEKNTWEDDPRPHPVEIKWKGPTAAFYDPRLNVHVFYTAGDSIDNGTMLAYRYKRAVVTK